MTLTRSTKTSRIQQTAAVTVLDATGRPLGRLATEVATYLTGKNRVDYSPNRLCGTRVVVENASQVSLHPRAVALKTYRRHTGYPGGARYTSLAELSAKRPGEVIRLAVSRMLPKNRLRARLLRRLTVKP